jgi:hypothetical protein
MEQKKLPPHFVRNAGVFYVCHRLSQMGWNAIPTMRYARGPNVLIESCKSRNLREFPFSALPRVAPYCVSGGVRVVSGASFETRTF